jgi:hypothetical protein
MVENNWYQGQTSKPARKRRDASLFTFHRLLFALLFDRSKTENAQGLQVVSVEEGMYKNGVVCQVHKWEG